MIFNTISNYTNNEFHIRESYKERNLYYKIFAGYIFNELIPGEEERKNQFLNLLNEILK